MQKKVGILGAGYAAMTAAALLAKYGFQVSVFEKNDGPGGRATTITEDGYTFDKGPSFYWMPDVFEHFFNQFGKSASDYYKLIRLDPSYKIFWQDREPISMPADLDQIIELFESIEAGSGIRLRQYLEEAKIKYTIGMGDFVRMPSLSFSEYADLRLLKAALKLDLFTSISKHVAKHFSNTYLKQILEFPVLFLGAKPKDTPALYSMMNYADIQLGTWYPMGGMYEVSKAMHQIGVDQGVNFNFHCEASSIRSEHGKQVIHFKNGHSFECDIILAGADYHHVENSLLEENHRSYNDTYWNSKKLAPSTLLYFMGFDQVIPNLEHHSLFFDADFEKHSKEIYDQPAWPAAPLFYTNSSSLTDTACAPAGHHNMVALIPVSPELKDNPEIKAHYQKIILHRLKNHTGLDVGSHLKYVRSYARQDFITDYHSYKGNAYGLANTLLQTGPFRPKIKSSKMKNLYYCGQLTVPGPGLPPALISGEIAANLINKEHKL